MTEHKILPQGNEDKVDGKTHPSSASLWPGCLVLGMGWEWGNRGQNWIQCNAKLLFVLAVEAPWLPGGQDWCNPAPDDDTPARNCQDPLKALKITQPKTKRKTHKWELWGKSSLGTSLLTRLELEGNWEFNSINGGLRRKDFPSSQLWK